MNRIPTIMLSVNVPVEILRGITIPTAEAKRKAWTACYTERTAVIPATNVLYLRSKQTSKNLLREVVKNITTEIYIRSLKARSGRLVSPESEVRIFLIRTYRLSKS